MSNKPPKLNIDTAPKLVMHKRNMVSTAGKIMALTAIVWQKPVIEAVILPAHAQTSTASDGTTVSPEPVEPIVTTTATPTPVQLVIPTRTISCTGNNQAAVFVSFYVDDSGTSPALVGGAPSAPATAVITGVSESNDPNNPGTLITEFVGQQMPGIIVRQRAQINCITGNVVTNALPAQFNFEVIATSGASWQATGMATASGSNPFSATISDITLMAN